MVCVQGGFRKQGLYKELYDLGNDPWELHNRCDLSEWLVCSWQLALNLKDKDMAFCM